MVVICRSILFCTKVVQNGKGFTGPKPENLTPLPGIHRPNEPGDTVCKDCGIQLDSLMQLKVMKPHFKHPLLNFSYYCDFCMLTDRNVSGEPHIALIVYGVCSSDDHM